MTQLTCGQCEQPIIDLDYWQAGIDMRQTIPVGVKTHPGECSRTWAKANPSGILWPDKATLTIALKAPTEARGAFLDAKGQKSPQKTVALKFAHHSQEMMPFDAIMEDQP